MLVNPCNSPEHGQITFTCTHYQQLLRQLFATEHIALVARAPVPRQLRQHNHPARRRDLAVEPRARQRAGCERQVGEGVARGMLGGQVCE